MSPRVPALTLATIAAIATASCAVNPEAAARARAQSDKELAELLVGRTAGPPVNCLPNYRTMQMQVVDDGTLVYRDGKTVYIQHPRSPCTGLKNGGYTLVTRQYGTSQLCDGDINQVVDLRNGMIGGSCVFSEFLPYSKP